MLLCVAQRGSVDDVELYVMSSHLEIGADEACEFLLVSLPLQERRREAHVEERATASRLVEFAERLDDRCRPVRVGTVRRRRAVADGEMRQSPVGRSPAHLSEIVVTGGAEHVKMRAPPSRVGSSLDGFHQVVVNPERDVVGAVVVVAEERRVVDDVLPHLLLPLEIAVEGAEDVVHGVPLVVEDVLLERRKAVGDGAQARALDVGGVVSRPSGVVVPALLHAVVDEEAEEGGGSVEGEHPFDVVVDGEFHVDEMHHLQPPCLVELLVISEVSRVAGVQAELLAGERVLAVVEGDFKDFRRVEVAGEQVSLLAEGPHLDAPGAAPFPCVLDGLSRPHHLLHVGVGVEERGIAVALSDDFDAFEQEVVRRVVGDVDAQARLQLVQFLLDFQNHI